VSRSQRPSPSRRPNRDQVRRRRRLAGLVLGFALIGIAWLVLNLTLLAPADTHGARVLHLTVNSRALGQDLGVDVVVPPGEERRRGLLVFLHGRGGSSGTFTDDEAMFEALARLHGRAPVIAFPSGGDHGYWHDRDEGDWARYVLDEVIPMAARESDADPRRVAIGGISMGGFGAYDIALHHPGRFCAVGGHSPALWLAAEDTAPEAFDDAEDFEANDVIATVRSDPSAFGAIPIWNDAGTEDPFLISDVAFGEALDAGGADLTNHVWPGAHDTSYWDRHWPAYLGFYARALADC
jgi:poly(3-hydroxybutyrate) depolymerase